MTRPVYATDEWFARVDASFADPSVAAGTSTSTIQFFTDQGGAVVEHYQTWANGRLLSWRRGRVEQPTLGVHDHSLPTSGTPRLECAHGGTDVLGVGGHVDPRQGSLARFLTLDVSLGLTIESPWLGECELGLVFAGPEILMTHDTGSDADVHVRCRHGDALRWLHDPHVLMGHLIYTGAPLSGDLALLSYVEGAISGLSTPVPDCVRVLADLAATDVARSFGP